MRRVVRFLALGALALAQTPVATPGATPFATPEGEGRNGLDKPGWTLTFHDEFDSTELDTSKWIDRYWHGRTHNYNEQQYYVPGGYEFGDGRLRFIAEQREMGGRPYTSGMVTSFERFAQQYGWFEIRARVPKGQGLWPAYWLLPATKEWPPEIDVLEILGHETNKVYFTAHWSSPAAADTHNHQFQTGDWVGPDFSADFHTFAVEWQDGLCVWYVDGVERHRSVTGIPDEPMYVIANLAVGGDWPGMPDATTPFPSSMDIDYIRVYQRQ
jgi:beta-glucanase (GH16 family)